MDLSNHIEDTRATATELIGMVKDRKRTAVESPYIPFLAMVSKPLTYKAFTTGETIKADDKDLTSRLSFMQQIHKTYPVTGTVCAGVASKIRGTIPNQMLSDRGKRSGEIHIGHPAGQITVEVNVQKVNSDFKVNRALVGRTARHIMDGYVYVPVKRDMESVSQYTEPFFVAE